MENQDLVSNEILSKEDIGLETLLLRTLMSARDDCINFNSVSFQNLGMQVGLAGDNKLMFVPYGEYYTALILKDISELEVEQD